MAEGAPFRPCRAPASSAGAQTTLRYVPASTPGERPPRCSGDAASRRYRAAVERRLLYTQRTVLRTAAAAVSAVLVFFVVSIVAGHYPGLAFERPGGPRRDAKLPLSSTGRTTFKRLRGRQRLASVLSPASRFEVIKRQPLFQISAGRYQQLRACHRFCPELPRGQDAPRPPARLFRVRLCGNQISKPETHPFSMYYRNCLAGGKACK